MSTLTTPRAVPGGADFPKRGLADSLRARRLMVIVVGLYSLASPIVETLLGDRQHYVEGKTSTVAVAAALDDLGAVVVPAIAIAATFVVLLFWRVEGPPLLLAIAPGLMLAANEFVHGRSPTLGLLITSAVGALMVSVRVKMPDLAILGHVGAVVAGASILAFVVVPSKVLVSGGIGTFDKSLTGAPLLAGIFSHSNTFGMFLALSLPCAFLARRLLVRLLLVAVICAALVLSSSRTALAGAGAVLAVMLLARLLPRAAFLPVAVVGFLTSVFAVFWLPFTETDPDAYTYRGAIWIFDRGQLGGHGMFGLGAHWFADNYPLLRNVLSSAASHAHNLALTTMVQGGAVVALTGGVLIVAAFVSALRHPSARERAVGIAFVIGLLVIGATETPMELVGWSPLSASVLVPLVVVAGRPWIEREEEAFARSAAADAPVAPLTRAALRRRAR
ncbi:hypothetical protein AB0230_09830 [Microbacterium sp. NPDC089190]|uniref:O-antigen ligase family protein n=1 Tax=Microbacterium sp. NPDC089190 TaxID=3155063 RepID=UPI00344B9A5B